MSSRVSSRIDRKEDVSILKDSFGCTEEQIQVLTDTAINVCDSTFETVAACPFWFTDHGPTHSDRVLYYAVQLARRLGSLTSPLSSIEGIFLASACYLHDIGMAHLPDGYDLSSGFTTDLIDAVRKEHPLVVAKVLRERKDLFESLESLDRRAFLHLAPLCEAHATSHFRSRLADLKDASTADLRLDMLARILLLADELDITRDRVPNEFPYWDSLPVLAKAHWLRHSYIMELVVDLPVIRLFFQFPDASAGYDCFTRWTIEKLRQQCKLVRDDMGGLREAFDLEFVPSNVSAIAYSNARQCTASIIEYVETQLNNTDADETRPAALMVRPRAFRLEKHARLDPTPVRRATDDLLEDAFKSLRTLGDPKLLKSAYVMVPSNATTMRVLGERIENWLSARFARGRESLSAGEPRRKIQVLSGPTGVGKSSFVDYLLKVYLPKSSSLYSERVIWCVIDCIGKQSVAQVIQVLAQRVSVCCRNTLRKRERTRIEAAGVLKSDPEIAVLGTDECRAYVESLCRVVQFPKQRANIDDVAPRFVILAIDNIDRVASFDIVLATYEHCLSMALETHVAIIVPLRDGTRLELKRHIDVVGERNRRYIAAPRIKDVLERRVRYAFDEGNRNRERYKRCIRAARLADMGGKPVELDDIGLAVQETIEVLVYRWEKHAILTHLAGRNIRAALDLFRSVLSSAWLPSRDFLRLRYGGTHHPYRLLQCIARGDHVCYQETRSPILNLFGTTNSDGRYFSRIALLEVLMSIQDGESGDDYVRIDELFGMACSALGYRKHHVQRELWGFLEKDYRLAEVEHVDGRIPNEQLKGPEDLDGELRIRATRCGAYYLQTLAKQWSYLQIVMEDTEVPLQLAPELAIERGARFASRAEAVRKFMNFLEQQERTERQAWPTGGTLGLIMPKVREEVSSQIDKAGARQQRGSLAQMLQRHLRDARNPVTSNEAALAVLDQGYATRSRDFVKIVSGTLSRNEQFIREGRGWTLVSRTKPS